MTCKLTATGSYCIEQCELLLALNLAKKAVVALLDYRALECIAANLLWQQV